MKTSTNLAEILKKHGIAPNPDCDQHFMIDEKLLKKIVSSAKIAPDDAVLEIGAGIGNLTKLIAKKAKKVYAVEKDALLEAALREEMREFQNVEIIIADILSVDFREFPKFDKIVSNLPYQICEALVSKLIFARFDCAVFCVPESFAETVCANNEHGHENENDKNNENGAYFSKLSIVSQAFFKPEIIFEAPKECFYPKPRTKSVLLKLVSKKPADFRGYFLQELLRQNGKKLKNALREAVIFAGKNSGGFVQAPKATKRAARQFVASCGFEPQLLEKMVAELSFADLRAIMYKLCV